MFKGFGRRTASVDVGKNPDVLGKENIPSISYNQAKPGPKPTVFQDLDRNQSSKSKGKPEDMKGDIAKGGPVETSVAFNQLLDDLQVPDSIRVKLNGMEGSVKAAMLINSQALAKLSSPPSPKKKPHNTLRKARSIESMSSSRPSPSSPMDFPSPPMTNGRFMGAAMASTTSLAQYAGSSNSAPQSLSNHARAISVDNPRSKTPALDAKNEASQSKAKDKRLSRDLSPGKFVESLFGTSSLHLDIELVKKLRLLLRNEAASWTETFLEAGGYSALLTRLNEILEVEWREEQHDDQLLHELLRCFKALTTSTVGCSALRCASPAPYNALVRLLFSDKKPGDVATRQLIVDLLLSLFELYPPSALPSSPGMANGMRGEAWGESYVASPATQLFAASPGPSITNSKLILLPYPHRSIFSLLRSLLLTPAPPPAEPPASNVAPHDFIEALHIPRIYKTYLQELSDICRDYFWVFCHPSNVIWNLEDTDEARVERPRAPGGMTGGVEFEAMTYLTAHFKLINAIAKSAADLKLAKEHELSAYRFHADLFASGAEKILLVARKASTMYYPTLHLEIGRYVSLAAQAQYELPWTISRLVAPPPAAMCKPGRSAKDRERERSARNQVAGNQYNRSGMSVGNMGPPPPRSRPATPARSDRASSPGGPVLPSLRK